MEIICTNSKKKIIGFDMDGVLIDSLPLMQLAWKKCCEIFQIEVKFSDYKLHIGRSFYEIMSILNLSEYLPEIKNVYDFYCLNNSHLIKPYPGIKEFLCKIKNLDLCHLAIITSKTKKRASKIVKEFDFKHDLLITPEDTSRSKPYPEPLLAVNEYFKIKPNNLSSIYVGDMQTDYEAALSANWSFLYADWGYGDIKQENYNNNISAKITEVNYLSDYFFEWLKK